MFEKRMARFSSAFASIPPFIILIHYENNDVIFWVKHIILGLLIWAFTDVIFRLIGKTIKELNYALTKSVDDSNSKSRLLQSLSHEIRTPLNGIVGAAEILNNQSDSEDSLNHILQKSSSRLTDTLNELVELSQLESLETHPDVVINVGKVTTAIVENYRQIAEKKDVYVELITDEALPSINWPRGYYETLLNHLLQNAVTYTKEGYIIVSVERIKKSGWFTLKVEDTGIGFSDSFRDIIFEPFSREAPDSGDSKGSGLGLAFVDKIVNIVNGELSLNSTKGVGSEFTLKLPEHAFSESEYR
jgi:two-component system chemotaxis sensor kinase CheA